MFLSVFSPDLRSWWDAESFSSTRLHNFNLTYTHFTFTVFPLVCQRRTSWTPSSHFLDHCMTSSCVCWIFWTDLDKCIMFRNISVLFRDIYCDHLLPVVRPYTETYTDETMTVYQVPIFGELIFVLCLFFPAVWYSVRFVKMFCTWTYSSPCVAQSESDGRKLPCHSGGRSPSRSPASPKRDGGSPGGYKLKEKSWFKSLLVITVYENDQIVRGVTIYSQPAQLTLTADTFNLTFTWYFGQESNLLSQFHTIYQL